jgi:hypothetical protein
MSNVNDVIAVEPFNRHCVQEEAEEVNGEDDGGNNDEDIKLE